MTNELGIDRSGNNNHWTVNNLTLAADQMLDTPTNNFCTLMPMANISLSEGNTKATTTRTGNWDGSHGSLGVSSGKWYYEVVSDVTDSDNFRAQPGWIAEPSAQTKTWNGLGGSGDPSGSHNNNYQNQPHTTTWYKDGSTDGTVATLADDLSIVQWAIDLDNNKVYYGVNNTWEANDGGTDGNPSGGTNESLVCNSGVGDYTPVFMIRSDGTIGSNTMWFNFGQDSSFAGTKTAQGNQDGNEIGDFYYTPPTGFLALCTSNLPDVAVTPSEHFDVRLRTGTGSEATVSDLEFQPDLLWTKTRSNAVNHNLHSSLMDENYSFLQTNTTNAEDSSASTYYMTPTSTGYTVGTGDNINQNTYTFVDWLWKANGSGSANTDGDLDSTVSVNTDAGFSIVSWESDSNDSASTSTIGHGLSQTAEMVITKKRSSGARNWHVGHKDLPFSAGDNSHNGLLQLNLTNANTTSNTGLADIPNATTFISRGDSGDDYIAYCFHSVDGYSKVGSYTGNGSTDGTFLYTGFRPMFVMTKVTSDGHHWTIYNTDKATYNHDATTAIYANSSDAEGTGAAGTRRIDLLSNGFKLRHNSYDGNANDENYIYIAFAETPFKYSNAR